MEQERRLNWIKTPLWVIYCGTILYFLFKANPYLYSQTTLSSVFRGEKSKISQPIPSLKNLSITDKIALKNKFSFRLNEQHNGAYKDNLTFNRKFIKKVDILSSDIGVTQSEIDTWSLADGGFFLVQRQNQLIHYNFKGETLWKFVLSKKGEKINSPVKSQEKLVFVTTNQGRLMALKKESGHLLWSLKIGENIFGPVFFSRNKIYLWAKPLFKPEGPYYLQAFDPKTGERTLKSSVGIRLIASYPPLVNEKKGHVYVVTEHHKLMAFGTEKAAVIWKSQLESSIIGPPVMVDQLILVNAEDSHLYALKTRNGREEWKASLYEGPSHSAPTLIPLHGKISVTTDSGYMQTVQLKNGDRAWRFNVRNESPIRENFTLRLKGNYIQELGMKWRHKGWVTITPCVSDRLCLFNPESGQIVGRINLQGQLISQIHFIKDREFVAWVNGKNGNQLSRFMEKSAYDKWKVEQQKAAEKDPPSQDTPVDQTTDEINQDG